MSKSTLGPIRLIDMHTGDMGGIGRQENQLLISLSLQCIAYGVYDKVDFWKEKCHDSESFKFNVSALMDRLNGYKKRNEKGPKSVPPPHPQQATSK